MATHRAHFQTPSKNLEFLNSKITSLNSGIEPKTVRSGVALATTRPRKCLYLELSVLTSNIPRGNKVNYTPNCDLQTYSLGTVNIKIKPNYTKAYIIRTPSRNSIT